MQACQQRLTKKILCVCARAAVQELNLAGNSFTGFLPPTYNQLTQLK